MAKYKEYEKGTYRDSDQLTDVRSKNAYYGDQQTKDFVWNPDTMLSEEHKNWYSQLNSLQKPSYSGFSKQQNWDANTSKLENMKDFTYDVNGDALYQQYKDQYVNQGKLAMMDTMGQAAAMTGGYGNSYAQSVGQQAYQGYLQQLNDKIPELYKLALDKYNSEKDNLYRMNDLYQNLFTTEYGQYRDDVSDYNTERNYLTDRADTTYERDFNTAYTENQSYNNNLEKNRNYWSGREDTLATREWGQYVDKENLTQKAIDIYNDKTYKENQDKTSELNAEINNLRNKYVVDNGVVSNAKKSILTEDEFNKKATKSFTPKKNTMGPLEPGFNFFDNNFTYSYENSDYSNYNDYVEKTIRDMYESGDIPNEATLNALLDHFKID